MTRTAVELVDAAIHMGRGESEKKPADAFMEATALDAEVAALRARVAELEAPRSPNALELADTLACVNVMAAQDGATPDVKAKCHTEIERIRHALTKYRFQDVP